MSLLSLVLAATGVPGGASPYSFPTYRLEHELAGMIARDLDGDGRRELIGFDPDDDLIQILDALPSFGWAPPRTIATSPDPRAFLLVEATGDALEDLVVAQASSVDVFPALGGGQFGAPLRTFTTFAVSELAAGDLDGDGSTDVVIVSGQAPIAILLNHGDGTFAAPIVQSFAPSTVKRAWTLSLDGDAAQDLALWLGNGERVDFLRSLGDGTFAPFATRPLAVVPRDVELVDVEGDGLEDLTLVEPTGSLPSLLPDRVRILPGVGPGAFGPASVSRLQLGGHLGRWDELDGDGRADFLLEGGLMPGVAYQDAALDLDPLLLPVSTFVTFERGTAAADADGDGLADLVMAESAVPGGAFEATVVVAQQRSARAFDVDLVLSSAEATTRLATGDVDGDGLDDAILARVSQSLPLAPRVDVQVSDGSGGFGAILSVALPLSTSAAFGELATGDFDGDGRLDLLVPTSEGTFAVLRAPDGSLATPVPLSPTPPFAEAASAGDVDGDGLDDALVGGRLYLGSPVGPVAGLLLAAGPGWTLGDVTGDGALDAVRALAVPPRLEAWIGDGQGGFAAPVTSPLPAFPADAPLAVDVDGDGARDVVLRIQSGSVFLLRSRGDGGFDPAVRVASLRTTSPVRSADVNGDGAADLVVASDTEHAVLLGVGDGTFGSLALHRGTASSVLALGRFVAGAPPGILATKPNTAILSPVVLKQP